MLELSNQVEQIFEIDKIFIEKRKVAIWEYWLFILGLEKEIDNNFVNNLIELCKKEKALFIQLETINYNDNSKIKVNNLQKWYYKKFITPYTSIIDLEKSEEDILKLMKPKGRYNIKLATKKGVEVKEVEKIDENIEKYYNLMLETTSALRDRIKS